MHHVRLSIATLAIGFFFSAASADVVQVGVFSGALSDGFETYGLGPVGPSFTFLGGLATNESGSAQDIYLSDNHDLGGSKGNYSGSTYMVGNDPAFTEWKITFSSPMSRFGGYWQSDLNNSSLTFDFYDANLAPLNFITVVPANVTALQWYGFEYPAGIGRVNVSSSQPYQIVDNFTADVVPEPLSMCPLGLTLVALARWRRT